MQAKHATKSVEELLQLKKYNMLYVNPEYQRGEVWTLPQKKLLVDSLMRGYPIPLVYLHHISRQVGAAHPSRLPAIASAMTSSASPYISAVSI